jgi:hypothetical protein
MFETSGVPTMKRGAIARVRRASHGRYTLMLSHPAMPGRGRVFFAYSLRHLAELVREHVPAAGIRKIAKGVARAAAA